MIQSYATLGHGNHPAPSRYTEKVSCDQRHVGLQAEEAVFEALKALCGEATQERSQQSPWEGRQKPRRMKGWASWPFLPEPVSFAKYQQNTCSALAKPIACG